MEITRKVKNNPKRFLGNGYLWGPSMRRWIRGRWICLFGAPWFSLQRPPNPCLEGFQSDLGQKSSAPHTQIQRPRTQQFWAELKGGAKRTEKQSLARMARRKPFFRDPPKMLSEEVAWGKFWEFVRDLIREMEKGGAKRTEVREVGNCFPRGVSSWGFAPPPLFCPPLWHSLVQHAILGPLTTPKLTTPHRHPPWQPLPFRKGEKKRYPTAAQHISWWARCREFAFWNLSDVRGSNFAVCVLCACLA